MKLLPYSCVSTEMYLLVLQDLAEKIATDIPRLEGSLEAERVKRYGASFNRLYRFVEPVVIFVLCKFREALEESLRSSVDSTSQKLDRLREQEEEFRKNVREDIVMLGKLIREEKIERINEDERIVSALDEFTRYNAGQLSYSQRS